MYSFFRVGVLLVGGIISATALRAAPPPPTFPAIIEYNPAAKIVQGNQPLLTSYTLTVTGPHTVTTPVTVNLTKTVLQAPTGLAAAALGYLQIPATVTFNTASERVSITVTVDVPLLGGASGDYQWLIKPAAWPLDLNVQTDTGATINAKVEPPSGSSTITPVVSITSPANNAEFLYNPATGPVTFPIRVAATVATGGAFIDSLGATLDFVPVLPMSFSPPGLGALGVTGTATSPALLPGTYVIRASASNTAGTTTATPVTVRVILDTSTPPGFCGDLEWLPPISHEKVVQGGSTVPIKFTIECDQQQKKKFVEDRTIVIAIDELDAVGVSISHAIYSYGGANGFSINGNHYHLNFATPRGAHRYRVEIFRPLTPSGTPLQSLGTIEIISR